MPGTAAGRTLSGGAPLTGRPSSPSAVLAAVLPDSTATPTVATMLPVASM